MLDHGKDALNLSILGPAGSGKGTLGLALQRQWGAHIFDTGKELRKIGEEDTPLGKMIRGLIDGGNMSPPDLPIEILAERIRLQGYGETWIWDGIPRNLEQVEVYREYVDKGRVPLLDGLVVLEAPRSVLVQRLLKRRICSDCDAIFNLDSAPPAHPDVCSPGCGAPLVSRADDIPQAIARRIELYEKRTAPAIPMLESMGVPVLYPDAGRSPDEVLAETMRGIEARLPRGHTRSSRNR